MDDNSTAAVQSRCSRCGLPVRLDSLEHRCPVFQVAWQSATGRSESDPDVAEAPGRTRSIEDLI
jgi:hypothetical protein